MFSVGKQSLTYLPLIQEKRKGFNTCDQNDSNECKTDVWFTIHTTCASGESGNNHGYNMKRRLSIKDLLYGQET